MTRSGRITAFLILQFVVTSAVAMALYESGNRLEPEADGYAFARNTFSDLGRVHGYQGEPKPLSRWLFTVSLTVGGAAVAVYHVALLLLFVRFGRAGTGGMSARWQGRRRMAAVGLGGLGAAAGLAVGGGLVAIANLPADLYSSRHFVAVYVAFTAFLPGALAVALAIVASPDYPSRYALIYVVLGVALAAYLILIYFGPPVDSPEGTRVQVVGQKLMVYLGTVCVAGQALATARVSP
jgi:hypothetical protein